MLLKDNFEKSVLMIREGIIMIKIAVVYWSGTGNTKEMANHVLKGAEEAGAKAKLFTASEFEKEDINNYDAFAFGCPSMGTEKLESTEFEPMFRSISDKLKGRKAALFGSYSWGKGEWMKKWEKVCRKAGAVLVTDSVIGYDAPDVDTKRKCEALGAALKLY